jgi:hypothetical protein
VWEARRVRVSQSSTLEDYMPDEKEPTARPGTSKEEVALELMRFVATTTGFGRAGTGAGFSGKSPKTPEEQVEALLQLYERCRTVVEKT